MPEIKLFVCCHEACDFPNHELLAPIQVGAALADELLPGVLYDNIGDNISALNRSYCELTAQYWAWKNCCIDYYGFFHYRRYLYPDANARWPYRYCAEPTEKALQALGYGGFEYLIEGADLIVPKQENMYVSVREHYAKAPFHHAKDLELAEAILRKQHPEYTEAMESYLSGTVQQFGNIFIMRRQVFFDYCAWLFPVLEEFDRLADISGYGPQELRVDGYLAERLLGIYYQRNRTVLKTLELPRVIFYGIGQPINARTRALCWLVPPGTRRRAILKKISRWKSVNGE